MYLDQNNTPSGAIGSALKTKQARRRTTSAGNDIISCIDQSFVLASDHPHRRDGRLVPSETMVALLKEAIVKGDSERFLLDGFPRSKDNLEAWFKAFSDDQVQVL